jgi:maltose alpha-D-glucosyltransferase/alpha-amylase
MIERWYSTSVVYCLDVDTFQDSNGDGVGDLPGLISRLDYLARLGVTGCRPAPSGQRSCVTTTRST